MKRLLIVGVCTLICWLSAALAFAVEGFYPGANIEILAYSVSVSADASTVELPAEFSGGYFYYAEIYASADDVVVLTINTATGTQLGTKTTTAATSGEWLSPAAFYPIVGVPTYTISGIGSGTVTLIFTVVKGRL